MRLQKVWKCFLASCLLLAQAAANAYEIPPLERRLDPHAWILPEHIGPVCQKGFIERAGLQKLAELQIANYEMEQALRSGLANAEWLRARGFLTDGSDEYINADERRKEFRQYLLPLAHTGFLFPKTVRRNPKSKWSKARIEVDPKTYQAAIIFIPGIGYSVSTSDTVLEIASTFSKVGNDAFDLPGGASFRALGLATDITLNGMAEGAPYIFGSRAGSMTMMRHLHLVLHILFPHLKIVFAGRSQGGLISIAYAQTYNDLNFVAAIGGNSTFPSGEILAKSNQVHIREDLLVAAGLDHRFHPRSFRSYLEFTEKEYTRVLNDQIRVPVFAIAGEFDRGYPLPAYHHAYEAWAAKQPGGKFSILKGASHHYWSHPIKVDGVRLPDEEIKRNEDIFNEGLQQKVNFLKPLIYPN